MFEALKNDAVGIAILREWLGAAGVPVPIEDATRRSRVCLQCPENQVPRWWESAKGKVARAIRRHLEIKNRIEMRVEEEEQLGICLVCRCCLPLKIHVPIRHVEAHTDPDAWDKFPSFCWIRHEANKA
jgi:hypothetical protein